MFGVFKKDWVFNHFLPTVFIFLLISLLVATFFESIFSIYFNSDDFFVLSQVNKVGLKKVWQLFLPIKEVVYYRPLGIQLFFWLAFKSFGLNYIYYHLVAFLIQLLNGFLVYLITQKISTSRTVGYLSALLWTTSSVHFLSLAWIVNFSYILVTFLYFLSFYFWLEKKYFLVFIFFILGILVSELIITLPLVFLVYSLIFRRNDKLFGFIALGISLIYLFFRFFIARTATGGLYGFSFNLKEIIDNFQWYFLWSFGWPETMRDQMVHLLRINPNTDFLSSFQKEFFIFILGFHLMIGLLFVKICLDFVKNRNTKLHFFSAFWFAAGLLPIIFMPKHAYPHYAAVSLFGLVLTIAVAFEKLRLKRDIGFFLIFLAGWLFTSKTSLELNQKVHWIMWHSELSQKLVSQATQNHNINDYQITIRGNIEQNRLVLSNQCAMKLLTGNDKIKTVYVAD